MLQHAKIVIDGFVKARKFLSQLDEIASVTRTALGYGFHYQLNLRCLGRTPHSPPSSQTPTCAPSNGAYQVPPPLISLLNPEQLRGPHLEICRLGDGSDVRAVAIGAKQAGPGAAGGDVVDLLILEGDHASALKSVITRAE